MGKYSRAIIAVAVVIALAIIIKIVNVVEHRPGPSQPAVTSQAVSQQQPVQALKHVRTLPDVLNFHPEFSSDSSQGP